MLAERAKQFHSRSNPSNTGIDIGTEHLGNRAVQWASSKNSMQHGFFSCSKKEYQAMTVFAKFRMLSAIIAAAGIIPISLLGQARYTITDEHATGQDSPMVVVLHDNVAGAEAAVTPTQGGELSSFKVTFEGRSVELLYHARDYDHRTGFQGKGPLLWPAVGAQYPIGILPKDNCGMGTIPAMGKTYAMPCHGFAQTLPWREISRSADDHGARVKEELTASDETRKYYPYKFQLDATYILADGHLTIEYIVKSAASNTEPMPFSIGNHLAFKIPFLPGTDPAKMLFETQNTIQMLRNSVGVLSGEEKQRSFYAPEELGSFDAHMALPLAGYKSQPFSSLIDPQGMTLRLTQTASTTLAEPLIRTNAYGSPEAGYFCPEPWFGNQNSFNTGIGLLKINPGSSWTWRLVLEIEHPNRSPLATYPGVERMGAGFAFVEGPVWVRKNGGYLLFSDIYDSRTMKLTVPNQPEVYRRYTHAGNGNAMDPQGRLYTADRDDHRVVRTDPDGSETTIASEYEGKRLNSPNDVTVRRDGQVYFSDPASASALEERQLDFTGVYHVNPQGKVTLIGKMPFPNGVALTQDGRTLYVADSIENRIYAYDLDKDGNASNGRVFISNTDGGPDGLRVATNGNLYIACKGVAIYSPKGELLKTILLPETPANLAFGGDDLKTLYITARTSVYRVRVPDQGWQP
jgi:gluconolactonase